MKCPQCGANQMIREEPFLARVLVAQSRPSQLVFMALALGIINYFLYGGLGFLDLPAVSLALFLVWVFGQIGKRKLAGNQLGWRCKACGANVEFG